MVKVTDGPELANSSDFNKARFRVSVELLNFNYKKQNRIFRVKNR